MFMSESYIHIREDISENDFLDIAINPRWRAKNDPSSKTLAKAQSEMNLTELKDTDEKQRTKSLSNLNYDGDTDSIDLEEEGSTNILLKCSICDIEYTAYIDDNQHSDRNNIGGGDDSIDRGESKKSARKSLRKKRRREIEEDRSRMNKINFEEYKDWAHRMEEFDPDAERKWTLEYQFTATNNSYQHHQNQLKLSKIVIGRGHKNEFPELNNIHLFDNVKHYETTKWRNAIFQQKIDQNKHVQACFSLLPLNATCLFCFSERQLEVSKAVLEGRPLVATVATVSSRRNGSNDFTKLDGCEQMTNGHDKTIQKKMNEEREELKGQAEEKEAVSEITNTNTSQQQQQKQQKRKKWHQNIMKSFKTKSFNSRKPKLKFKKPPRNIQEEAEEEDNDDDNEEFEVLECEGSLGVL